MNDHLVDSPYMGAHNELHTHDSPRGELLFPASMALWPVSVYGCVITHGESGAYQEATLLVTVSITANGSLRASPDDQRTTARCLNCIDERVGLMETLLTEAFTSDP